MELNGPLSNPQVLLETPRMAALKRKLLAKALVVGTVRNESLLSQNVCSHSEDD
jgi:hypothetical protein